MEKYLGVKLIDAEPQYKPGLRVPILGEKIVAVQKGEGYKVVYEDGYTSWSPKDVFEKAYRRIDNLTFGLAIEALKLGKCIARKGWNGSGMFVCKQVPANIDLEIIDGMQSLPRSAKDILLPRDADISYCNQMIIVKPDNTIDSWVASSSDTFAEDWEILE